MDLDELTDRARNLGLDLGPDDRDHIHELVSRLDRAGRRLGLTRITGEEAILVDLVLDSFTLVPSVDRELARDVPSRLVDVGSGAGFPAIPLALVRPDLEVRAVESRRRKASFIRRMGRVLGLSNLAVETVRAEDLGRDPGHRGTHGLATARAVGPLAVCLELCLPLVAPGGVGLFPRGGKAREEAEGARGAIETLGGGRTRVEEVDLPGRTDRHLVTVQKVGPTPEEYPRRAGDPARDPLG